jgi:hypothetical protein
MFRNVKDLRGYAIRAIDGVIGEVHDLYFDDEDWAIRYLVVDTGSWLSGRKVIISPLAIGDPDWASQQLPVSLTKAQVERNIGHLKDLLVDDRSWAIRYLIVDTSNWWGGHDVLVAPQWIETVGWSDAKVYAGLIREAVKNAPAYDSAAHLDRQQEQAMYEHYGRPGYWLHKSHPRNRSAVRKVEVHR